MARLRYYGAVRWFVWFEKLGRKFGGKIEFYEKIYISGDYEGVERMEFERKGS